MKEAQSLTNWYHSTLNRTAVKLNTKTKPLTSPMPVG